MELSEWTGKRTTRRSERANGVKEQKGTKSIERERKRKRESEQMKDVVVGKRWVEALKSERAGRER